MNNYITSLGLSHPSDKTPTEINDSISPFSCLFNRTNLSLIPNHVFLLEPISIQYSNHISKAVWSFFVSSATKIYLDKTMLDHWLAFYTFSFFHINFTSVVHHRGFNNCINIVAQLENHQLKYPFFLILNHE